MTNEGKHGRRMEMQLDQSNSRNQEWVYDRFLQRDLVQTFVDDVDERMVGMRHLHSMAEVEDREIESCFVARGRLG